MKLLGIIILAILIIFLIFQLYSMNSNKSIEKYPYSLIKKYNGFETRTYESRLFSTVKLPGDKYENISGQGFSALAGYIFGGNEKKQKISMTSPVTMALEDSITMMFMVPEKYNRENLPQPNNSDIKFIQEPAKKVAAIRFGGWANSEKIEAHKAALLQLLEKENIAHSGNFYFLGYNPPYEILSRRNEIIVELDTSSLKHKGK